MDIAANIAWRTCACMQAGQQPAQQPLTDQQASQPQALPSRSPTPDVAAPAAAAPPPALLDNDMTLPWNDPPHQGDSPDNSSLLEDIDPTQANEPMQDDDLELPDTQATAMNLPAGPPRRGAVMEPTQLLQQPTQLARPLAPPSDPSSSPAGASKLASAAAQALSGAQPTQASGLLASAAFPASTPSVAMPGAAQQTVPTAAASTARAQPGSGMQLPISKPQADAVLHLPSQPSGSQHAQHPHGPPRSPLLQSHASAQQAEAHSGSHAAPSAPAQANSAPAQSLLDNILGHDDTDSIWEPAASLAECQHPSQGPSQPQAQAPPALPSTGGTDLPLLPTLLNNAPTTDPEPSTAVAKALTVPGSEANAVAGAQSSTVAPVTGLQLADMQPEAAQPSKQTSTAEQVSDSETQDSEDEQRARAGASGQGRQGKGPAAGNGMLTGAFAFPESSLEASQPAVAAAPQPAKGRQVAPGRASKAGVACKAGISKTDTPDEAAVSSIKAGSAGKSETADQAASSGSKAGSSGQAVQSSSHTTGTEAGPASSRHARALPSTWKTKKASDATPDQATAPAPAPAAGMFSIEHFMRLVWVVGAGLCQVSACVVGSYLGVPLS